MSDRAVFFCRCKPQGSDPIDLVLRYRKVFIGWPAWKRGVKPRRGHLSKAVVDIQCDDGDWEHVRRDIEDYGRQHAQNRNLIRGIGRGAIALVPRPDRGVIYAGRVTSPFEFLDDPPWADEYLTFRKVNGCDEGDGEFSHLADVAHCCEVDEFRPLPFPLVPVWIRASLFGRSTYGRIRPIEGLGLDPYQALDPLLDGPKSSIRHLTSAPAEVERRLLEFVGPSTFEHLCVALLQLEYPDEVWAHVGGSGDGGADGIGSGPTGEVVGILQCKWKWDGKSAFGPSAHDKRTPRRILASLLHESSAAAEIEVEFWPRSKIAQLILKHNARLPIAVSLRLSR